MENKTPHYCKYNKKTIYLTPIEHRIAHDLEHTAFTPYFYSVKQHFVKMINKNKKQFHFIKAWRIKKLLKYYDDVLLDKQLEMFNFYNTLYVGRANGKTFFATNLILQKQYRDFKKKHKYIKAYKIKRLIKKQIKRR